MNKKSEIIGGVLVMEDAEDKPKKTCGCWSAFRRLFRRLFRKKKRDTRNTPCVNDVKGNETKEAQEIEETVQQDEEIEVISESTQEEKKCIEENVEELKETTTEEKLKDVTVKEEKITVNEDAIEEQEDETKIVNMKKEAAMVDVGLLDGVMHVCGEDADSSTQSWAEVCSKKRRQRKQKMVPPPVSEVKQKATLPAPNKMVLPPRYNTGRAKKDLHDSFRNSLDTTLRVAPHMRRCIVGPRGATLKQVQQEFVGVRVTVPPPLDAVTDTVRVRGPARQVAGTMARLKALLHKGEVIKAELAVTPRQRCHVVGPVGATVKTLLQEFSDVAVTVPPPKDRKSCTVRLKGPRCQVTGAQTFLNICLKAAIVTTTTTTHRHNNTSTHRHA